MSYSPNNPNGQAVPGNSQPVTVAAADALGVSQVSVAVSSTLVIAANPKRLKVRIINTSANAFYIGPTTPATTANGAFVPGIPGYPFISRFSGALYAIAMGGAALVTVDEESSS